MLKSQDVLVLCRLLIARQRQEMVTYPLLSQWTGLSASESHAAIRRGLSSGLLTKFSGGGAVSFPQPVVSACQEFLFHALKYVFPLESGKVERGVVTGTDAPGLNQGEQSVLEGETWVWAYAEGTVRGTAITPLYRTVPQVVLKDEALHQALASLDLIRSNTHRLRRIGEEWIRTQLLHS